jgi:hypothetical protein
MVSLALNNPPRISFTPEKSSVKKNVASNMRTLGVKWRKVDFPHMLSSALKCTLRIVTIRCDLDSGLTWPHVFLATWAGSLAIRSALESGLPRGYSCFGKPQYLSVELSKWVNSSIGYSILHRQFPCLLRRIFLMPDSTSVKPISGGPILQLSQFVTLHDTIPLNNC